MEKGNISIFIPHAGCPHCCSFCSQNTISDTEKIPLAPEVKEKIKSAYDYYTDAEKRHKTEIAFFGGSFTAVPRKYMLSLLDTADEFISENGFYGIRISTRPDYINEEILDILKSHKVTSIELGAQSMDDEVLINNERGHLSEDVVKSSALIREYGFELGLQVMTGLYTSSREKDFETFNKIAACKPQTVRIYPTVIIDGTKLGEYYKQKKYVPYSFDEMVNLCADGLILFHKENIKVIKLGLHAEKSLEEKILGGFYHPAFAEIVKSEIFRRNFSKLNFSENEMIEVSLQDISAATGYKKSNIKYFKNIKIKGNESLKRDEFHYCNKLINIWDV